MLVQTASFRLRRPFERLWIRAFPGVRGHLLCEQTEPGYEHLQSLGRVPQLFVRDLPFGFRTPTDDFEAAPMFEDRGPSKDAPL